MSPCMVRCSRYHQHFNAVARRGQHGERVPRIDLSVWVEHAAAGRLVTPVERIGIVNARSDLGLLDPKLVLTETVHRVEGDIPLSVEALGPNFARLVKTKLSASLVAPVVRLSREWAAERRWRVAEPVELITAQCSQAFHRTPSRRVCHDLADLLDVAARLRATRIVALSGKVRHAITGKVALVGRRFEEVSRHVKKLGELISARRCVEHRLDRRVASGDCCGARGRAADVVVRHGVCRGHHVIVSLHIELGLHRGRRCH
mmetsp:Transcript_25891/g.67951  ORF Transcript_25891/g.67951 Transcript_25891/m.67951 type:complete len:260 (+) Transcript_25891:2359-3138(+)